MNDLASWLFEQIAEDELKVPARDSRDDYGTGWNSEDLTMSVAAPRWLAECQAKRAIIEEHHKVEEYADPITFCSACGGNPSHGSDWPCYTLRLLALSYADRPGYREEWRP